MGKYKFDFLDDANTGHEKSEQEKNQEREDNLRTWFFKSIMRYVCTEKIARERLNSKCDDPILAKKLLQEAIELKLIDDANYALLFAAGHDTWGNRRIAFELGQRGVAKEYIDRALANLKTSDTVMGFGLGLGSGASGDGEADKNVETARARALAEPWLAAGIEKRKVVARLQRRGFSSNAIRAACRGEDDIGW